LNAENHFSQSLLGEEKKGKHRDTEEAERRKEKD
jgi:hypothetical protein